MMLSEHCVLPVAFPRFGTGSLMAFWVCLPMGVSYRHSSMSLFIAVTRPKLATALKADEFVTAEELGGNLPTTIESVRAAVAAESSVQSGT